MWMSTIMASTLILVGSSLLCIFANSWISIWVFMEMNTMAFCMLSIFKNMKDKKPLKEEMMKYFVIQSIASGILITSMTLIKFPSVNKEVFLIAGMFCLMLKMGAAPIHYWFISVMKKIPWTNGLVLLTWQKLVPIYLTIFQKKTFTLIFLIFSLFTGSFFLFNKKSMKEILALSSIFNLGWMMSAIFISTKTFIVFSMIYWSSLSTLIYFLTKLKKNNLMEINEISLNKIPLFFLTINLAGIPPFIMFLAKWNIMMTLLKIKIVVLPLVILTLSSVNAYIYLRMANPSSMSNSTKSLKKKEKKSLSYLPMLMIFTCSTFLMIP